MSKIMKLITSVMFVVLCILVSLALLDEGRQKEIERLEKINLEELHHE